MPAERFDGEFREAEALAEQVRYQSELKELGQEKNPVAETVAETLPDVGHRNSPVKVDERVTDWHFPSDEERATLRRVPEKLHVGAFAIGICELAERFSFYGATQVFTNFIAHKRPTSTGASYNRTTPGGHKVKTGALGKGSEAANGLVTFNQFWCYFTPLVGAYLADARLGRYNTLVLAVCVAMVGHILLTVSAIPSVLDNPQGAYGCFILAIIIMGFGTGLFKSNCSVLIAEQIKIKEMTVVELKSGEKVIVDPALTYQHIYMWFYMLINIGSLGGQLGMIYAEEYVGFWLSYLLPTIVFIVPFPVLWFGRNYYVKMPPQGSILETAVRTWFRALKVAWSWRFKDILTIFNRKNFWEPVKPSNIPVQDRPKWMVFDDVWVEELSRGTKACAVFILFPFYWLCYNQILNNLIFQAGQMNTGSSPIEIVSQLDPIFLIVLIPLFNLLIYPAMERYKIGLSPIKRITIGFFFSSLAMVWAAVLQHLIYTSQPCGSHLGDSDATYVDGSGKTVSCEDMRTHISVWAQSGCYVLIALGEVFASVVSMEIAMLMAPKSMRSIVMGISIFTTAIAAAIGEAFNPLAQNPLFVANYVVFACLAFVSGILFYLVFFRLDRAQEQLNLIGQGKKAEISSFETHKPEQIDFSTPQGTEHDKDNKLATSVDDHKPT